MNSKEAHALNDALREKLAEYMRAFCEQYVNREDAAVFMICNVVTGDDPEAIAFNAAIMGAGENSRLCAAQEMMLTSVMQMNQRAPDEMDIRPMAKPTVGQ